MKDDQLGFNSKLVHAGAHKDAFGSAVVPIYQTSTFAFENADHGAKCFSGESDGYIYTRIGNPTISALEKAIASLENGFGGIATSSGMAAVNTVYMAYLNQGAHIISHDAIYGPARVIVESLFSKFGVEYTYLDAKDTGAIKKAVRPNTKMIYIETPANPTMDIIDIKTVADIAHKNKALLVVDNTFCSPYLQKPIDFGADIILHSMTKFINGHADIVAGMLVARNQEIYKALRSVMVSTGCNIDPHQAFLVHRGVKTLSLRIDRAQQNAIQIAKFLEKHPKVEWVKYPGLPSHPQFELAKKQMNGPGAMISFELKGGLKAGKTLMDNVHLIMLAVSLGGIESLIQHPASMTHAKMSKENQLKAGITEGLVRFSVGIENVEDILNDIEQALNKI